MKNYIYMLCISITLYACNQSDASITEDRQKNQENAVLAAKQDTGVQHYIFVNRDREYIYNKLFLETSQLIGAQIKYTWRQLEKTAGVYDFSMIQEDYDFLQQHDKQLFIQLQDVSFSQDIINVPAYLQEDSRYSGGIASQYVFSNDETETDAHKAGWVSRRWDSAVQERYYALLTALAEQFDGKIAGITLPETAVDFGSSGAYYPLGFTPDVYIDAIEANMLFARRVFQKTIVLQYINFMPGEWLPWDDSGYLARLFKQAQENEIGVGGPDVIPYRKGQMNNSYPFIKQYNGVFKGMAVQDGNLGSINAKTQEPMTVMDIVNFSQDYLQLDALFWGMEEPYFSQNIIPYITAI